jgi:RNA polymerase sigma-70 factor (ECF subfamily)
VSPNREARGDAGSASALVRAALVGLARSIETARGGLPAGTWLYRAAVRDALGRLGTAVAGPAIEAWLPAFEADGHRAGPRAMLEADWSRDPAASPGAPGVRARLEAAMDGLPAAHRAVLVLREVEGLSGEEAATVLGEPAARVKDRLHEARMALREQLTRALVPAVEPGAGLGASPAAWPALSGRRPA